MIAIPDWVFAAVRAVRDTRGRFLGTCFLVHCDESMVFATCAHVLPQDPNQPVQIHAVAGPVEVLWRGRREGPDDLALLRAAVEHNAGPGELRAFTLGGAPANDGSVYCVANEAWDSGELTEPKQMRIASTAEHRTAASQETVAVWTLRYGERDRIIQGHSGGPLLTPQLSVIGVITSFQDAHQRGLAIRIEELVARWPQRPASIKVSDGAAAPSEAALLALTPPRLAYQSDAYFLSADVFEPVRFEPVRFALPTAGNETVRVDELLAASFDGRMAPPQLGLVLPFPPDCRETLLYLYARGTAGAWRPRDSAWHPRDNAWHPGDDAWHPGDNAWRPGDNAWRPGDIELRSVFWCDGAASVAAMAAGSSAPSARAMLAAGVCANPSDDEEVSRIAAAMSQWRAALLLVDLSGLDIEQLLDEPKLARALRTLYNGLRDWLKQGPTASRNRVAIALPRSFEAAGVGGTLLEELWPQSVFYAADPASLTSAPGSRLRFAPPASELFEGRTLGNLLDVFTHYNSNALREAVTALLDSEHVDPNQPPHADFLLHAADRLRMAGFLEVAYRLEVLFRHVEASRPSQPRGATLCRHQDLGLSIVAEGCAADVRALPMIHSRFVLLGVQGIGKSVSLDQIEEAYAIPYRERPVRSFANWLPIRLDAVDPADGWLARSIAARSTVVRRGQGKEPRELRAHRKLAALLERANSRRLLSAPLLLLIDNAEEIDWSDASPVWTADGGLLERAGVILAWGEEEAAASPRAARLREYLRHAGGAQMEGMQFSAARALFQDLGGRADIEAVRIAMEQPIHGMLQRPEIVACLATLPDDALGGDTRLTLFDVLQHKVHDSLGADPDLEDEIVVDEVLPAAAYQRRIGAGRPELDEDEARRASRAGLVEPSARLKFTSRLMEDYFVAREMQRRFARDPAALTFDVLRGAPERWERHHEDLVRMLCSALPRQGVERLVEHLVKHRNARLAHAGLLELGGEDYARLPQSAAVAARLVEEASAPDSEAGRRAAAALSFRDPRIPKPGRLIKGFLQTGDGAWFGLWPVTNLEFHRFVRERGYLRDDPSRPDNLWSPSGRTWKKRQGVSEPAFWRFSDYTQPNQPVVGVSFYEAKAYCAWLTEKLRAEVDVPLVVDLPRPQEWDLVAGLLEQLPDLVASAWALKAYAEGHPLPPKVDPQTMLDQALAPIAGEPDGVVVRPRPIGIGTQGREGPHGLYGSIWQWCNEDLGGGDLNDTEAGERRTAMVRGGPRAYVSMMTGGGLDMGARVHVVGFRVVAVTEKIQAVRRASERD